MALIAFWMMDIYYKTFLMTAEVETDLLDITASIIGLVLPEFETLIVKGVFDPDGEVTYEEVDALLTKADLFLSQAN